MAGEIILLIDDNAQNLKLARVVLAGEGFVVHAVHDAEAALQLLETITPHLVLTDVQLPGMDGLELTRRLRADPQRRHIPIIAMTAYAMKGDRERMLAAGCDDYVAKPIDTEGLPRTVRERLEHGVGTMVPKP